MSIFSIDPVINRAQTLSSEFYLDENYFELSKEKLFSRSWQLIGHRSEITGLSPKVFLEGFIDEQILLTLDDAKGLACISNVCTHRGKILVETDCKADGIRCGYHGRTFSLDGRFRSMPEFDDAENFPAKTDD
ncbi:MAG: Rieske 2Fe-2S domain-containing protein, partial [Acidobacteria bacterium]|nr:Rieske 2Fe-2S domain-containing protein [Acidobacteriota bacterium]